VGQGLWHCMAMQSTGGLPSLRVQINAFELFIGGLHVWIEAKREGMLSAVIDGGRLVQARC
jgi:hypothetical protein